MPAELFLTDGEIAALCTPLAQPAAQIRYLRGIGLTVTVKPNGRPAVVRSHAEAVLSGQRQPPSLAVEKPEAGTRARPNVDGFLKLVQGSKKHGTPKKVQPA